MMAIYKQMRCCRDSIPDEALELIFSFIDDPWDRFSISLVCKRWHEIDSCTRKEVTVAFCYTTNPARLTRRFTNLQSLKVKGKPRADMYNLMPHNWGAFAGPWIEEVARNCSCLTSLHLRRMVITDDDLLTLAEARNHRLKVLKLDRCSGFSTTGLEAIAHYCRQLRILFLDESYIIDHSGDWLHEIALHNTSLEVLNFVSTGLSKLDVADLNTIAMNCKSLVSLKVSEVDLSDLTAVLETATSLKELGGVTLSNTFNVENEVGHHTIGLLKGLTSLVGLFYMEENFGDANVNSLVQPLASGLKRLDLQTAALSIRGHCQLLCHCKNLDVLEVLNGIGDEGLEIVANNCKNLRRLRVESGDKEFQQGFVTQRGVIAIAQNCKKLEYIAVYMSDVNNAALRAIGEGCPKLRDFRLVLLHDDVPNNETQNSDFPLDSGVYDLLDGCRDLTRLALYLKRGALTDTGMKFIGMLGKKLRWALLGLLGHTDEGFSWFADGCPKLERLEMRDCIFTEAGISKAILKMKSLKYVWVQGYNATPRGYDLLAMKSKKYWNIEFIPEHTDGDEDEYATIKPVQFLAYHSLAGTRQDCPREVQCLL